MFNYFREWITGIHRDTYASILSHSNLQLYMSAAEDGESLARTRYNLINVNIKLLSSFDSLYVLVNDRSL